MSKTPPTERKRKVGEGASEVEVSSRTEDGRRYTDADIKRMERNAKRSEEITAAERTAKRKKEDRDAEGAKKSKPSAVTSVRSSDDPEAKSEPERGQESQFAKEIHQAVNDRKLRSNKSGILPGV